MSGTPTTSVKPPVPPPAKLRVLFVDDEPALRDVWSQLMAGAFIVETATSAAEAETRLALENFDVILCDHLMPGENGLDFFVRNFGRWPEMRRILLTGYMNPELISRSVALAGLSSCVIKPVAPSELIGFVHAAMAGK